MEMKERLRALGRLDVERVIAEIEVKLAGLMAAGLAASNWEVVSLQMSKARLERLPA